MKSLPLAAIAAFALAALPATAEAGKSNSVTVGVPQIVWPALHAEYERKLLRKVSVGAFASAGQYDPFIIKLAMGDSAGPTSGLNMRAFGLRANLFAIGGFKHGLILGLTGRWGRLSTSADGGELPDVTLEVGSALYGTHLGYKLIVKPGITVSMLGGIGYHKFGDVTVTAGPVSGSEDLFADMPPVATYGTINAGWSF